ncbi:MAG: Flp1 family type IVb pilin [Butyribacter sp.]|nr:Flp1 family type IVb pilin [bacterium]MDY3854217.1 Flp1 family type IVb pilin [Butyribacter sp.]
MNQIKAFLKEEDGIGVVEIILILVVLIMLVVIFRDQITAIVKNAFTQINGDAKTINGKIKIK